MIRILTEPKSALVKQYKKLMELDGVSLEFDEDALTTIADEALIRKTGARGLRAIMENTMDDIMFEVPSDETIDSCRITKDSVLRKSEPLVTHNEDKKAPQHRRTIKHTMPDALNPESA